MKKVFFVLVALGVLGAGIFFILTLKDANPKDTGTVIPPSGTYLCERVQRDFIDFAVLNEVYGAVKQYSIHRDTASDPGLLLNGALTSLFGFLAVSQSDIPQWAQGLVDDEISKQYVDFSVFNTIYNRLRADPQYQDLNDPQRSEELLISAINGLLDALDDPFAYYVSAQDFKLGATDLSGSYKGIGVQMQRQEGYVVIQSVFPGSPASRAGLKYGDKVLSVDGKSAEGCSIAQFASYIKSKPGGTTLTFKVERLTREVVELPVTTGEVLVRHVFSCPGVALSDNRGSSAAKLPYDCPVSDGEGTAHPDILYIKFEQFTEQAFNDLTAVLEKTDLTQFRGVIIDVRGNPGGLLNVTTDMLDLFLDDEILFRIKSSSQSGQWNVRAYRQNRFEKVTDLPIAVLVDRDSYSASELFSASMKDTGRAEVIGMRTGGKGTIHNKFDLRRGEYGTLSIGVAFFLSPNGDRIEFEDLNDDRNRDPDESGGVTPTREIALTDDDIARQGRDPNYDPVLFEALKFLQEQSR